MSTAATTLRGPWATSSTASSAICRAPDGAPAPTCRGVCLAWGTSPSVVSTVADAALPTTSRATTGRAPPLALANGATAVPGREDADSSRARTPCPRRV
eukprot:12970965-Alexandrium_andersonii.AAC.1